MNLLTLDSSNKLVITPEALAIKEFSDIWKLDYNAKKEKAIRELSYIYFSCDYNSVYKSYAPAKREKQIKLDLDLRIVSSNVIAGVKKYNSLQSTPSLRILNSGLRTTEEVIKYLSKVNLTKRDDKGKPLYDVEDVMKYLAKIAVVVETLEKLKEKVKLEEQDDTRIRGGGTTGAFEDPEKTIKVA